MPINYTFYNTNNFEVFCFCPIIIKSSNIILIENDKNNKDTDYFLVGGFDSLKKEGIIKLYKVIYIEELKKNTIEFIQDFIFYEKGKSKRFKGPISCITQSSLDNQILVTCWDGNIYLFDPDIKDYLEYDEQVKNQISFKNYSPSEDIDQKKSIDKNL